MCEDPIDIYHKEKGWIKVKCGKCTLCRKNKCRDWAIKLIKEKEYYNKACMLTVTFRLKFLLKPFIKKLVKFKTKRQADGTIKKWKIKYTEQITPEYIKDVKRTGWLLTLFLKKMRKELSKTTTYISYFAVGEHGTKNTHRAHWHILIFGISKEDLESIYIGKSGKNKDIFFSPIIDKLWSYKKIKIGKHTISDVTDATVKYVANYTMKKLYTGGGKLPVVMRFSNQNKIGIKWARYNHKEMRKGYLSDNEGKKYRIPPGFLYELKRYENDYWNSSKNETLAIIETLLEEKIKEIQKHLNLTEENRKKGIREKFRQQLFSNRDFD